MGIKNHYWALVLAAIGVAVLVLDAGPALAQEVDDGHCVEAPGYPCKTYRRGTTGPTRSAAEINAANRASAHWDRKEWSQAIQAYQEAVDYCRFGCEYLHNNITVASRMLASNEGDYWHNEQGNYDLAIAAYQRALTFCTRDTDCQYLHDNIRNSRRSAINKQAGGLFESRDWDAAIWEYERALAGCAAGDDCAYLRGNIAAAKSNRAIDRATSTPSLAESLAAFREALVYCASGDVCNWIGGMIAITEGNIAVDAAQQRTNSALAESRALISDSRPSDPAAYFDQLRRARISIDYAISSSRAFWRQESRYVIGVGDTYFDSCCRFDISFEILKLAEALGELWYRDQYRPAKDLLDRIIGQWGDYDELLIAPSDRSRHASFGAYIRYNEGFQRRKITGDMVSELSAAGEANTAVDRIRTLLEGDPGNIDLWYSLVEAEKSLGEIQAIIKTKEIIVSLEPTSRNLNNLAIAYADAERYDDAKDFYRQAVRADPGSIYALSNLAGLLVSTDPLAYDEAVDLYARALAQTPGLGDMSFYEELKERARELEEDRDSFRHTVRKAVWQVKESEMGVAVGDFFSNAGDAVSEGISSVFNDDVEGENIDQAELAAHYGGLAVERTDEISENWQEFYLAERAGESSHFLASLVFDRGVAGGGSDIGSIFVAAVEGGPVFEDDGPDIAITDEMAGALLNEPDWMKMAVQKQAIDIDLVRHRQKLADLEQRAEITEDPGLQQEIKVKVEEARSDIANAEEEQQKVVKKMATFFIDFGEQRSADGTDTEKQESGQTEPLDPAGGGF